MSYFRLGLLILYIVVIPAMYFIEGVKHEL
jgi:hypothetical protein